MKENILNTSASLQVRNDKDLKNKYHILILLIWPLMAFIAACRDFSVKLNRNIILIFYVLYGLTFFINPLMDGQRYANELTRMYKTPTEDYAELFEGSFQANGELDFLQPVVTFIVSRFTSFHGALFAVFALIFGIFQLKSINALFNETKTNHNKNVLFLLWFMPLMLPIFSINGFRMWTAAWIFFYGAYNFGYLRKKIFILVCFSAILVHFSFITLNLVLILYVFGGNRRLLYTILALLSFTLSQLPLDAIQGYVTNFGSGITRKFTSYTHKRYTEETFEAQAQAVWFIKWSAILIKYFFAISIGIMYYRLRNTKLPKGFDSLWCLTLLILTYANLASTVPSGGRFLTVYYIFATALLIIYYSRYYTTRKLDTILILGLIPMIMISLINIRVGFNTVDLSLLLPGPFIPFFLDYMSG